MATHAAVFVDKDGTLINDLPYNVEPSRMQLAPGVLRGAALLTAQGFRLIVISNQPGVALGLHAEHDLEAVHEWLARAFDRCGVPLAGMYWCPHHPRGLVPEYSVGCDCRKPAPGLILRAASEHDIALERSWFIGDILDDIEAGRRAGCRTVLIDNGNETAWRRSPLRTPDHVAMSFGAAADWIVEIASRASGAARAPGRRTAPAGYRASSG
jgi:D-glycero-D-manno-heptose 1,7-bisphosphate phosphatase